MHLRYGSRFSLCSGFDLSYITHLSALSAAKSNKWLLQLQQPANLTKRISFTSTAQTRLQMQENTGSGETNTLKEGSSTLIQCRDDPPAAISQRIDCIDQTSGAKSTPTRHTSPIHYFILPRASKVWRDVTPPHPSALGKHQFERLLYKTLENLL